MDVKDACEVVDIVQQVCAENLPVGHGSEKQDTILAKAIRVEQCQCFQLLSIYHVQLL
jgi:hypothetical protein